ncbi:exlusion protein FxsA [Vibrio cholerae]|nr:exlusion protein FxsA [Vibrio cholerae]
MSTRGVSSPNEPRWFRLLCLSLVVVRCQPLRRALCITSNSALKG